MSRAKELTNAHWDGYVGPLLKACGVANDLLPMLEFVYKTSGIHFYGHAQEDVRETARAAFQPLHFPPAHPYPHEDEIAAAELDERTCATCKSIHCKQRGTDKSGCSFWSKEVSITMPFQPHEEQPEAREVNCKDCMTPAPCENKGEDNVPVNSRCFV